jgi:hypothetical protein
MFEDCYGNKLSSVERYKWLKKHPDLRTNESASPTAMANIITQNDLLREDDGLISNWPK